jgi:serine/threonine protein kinase
MGEVYRARDTRLNREVAIKILPEAYAAHADRGAPFHREAQVLASLNHPHIGGIYGLEELRCHANLCDDGFDRSLIGSMVIGEDVAESIFRRARAERATITSSFCFPEPAAAAYAGIGIATASSKPTSLPWRISTSKTRAHNWVGSRRTKGYLAGPRASRPAYLLSCHPSSST